MKMEQNVKKSKNNFKSESKKINFVLNLIEVLWSIHCWKNWNTTRFVLLR